MKRKILIFLVTVNAGMGLAFAQLPTVVISDEVGWRKIGETAVDFKRDRDELLLVGSNRFASIKIKVANDSVDLKDLEIYYANGKMQDAHLNRHLLAGSESRVIDLEGKESSVSKIVMVYKSLPNSKAEKATVEVWGLKTNAGEKPTSNTDSKTDGNNMNPENGEIPVPAVITSDKEGWYKIATTHVDFKKDRDEIKLMGKDHFRQIKLKVTDAAIEMTTLEIYFENDTSAQRINVNTIMKQGDETHFINLKKAKGVDKIAMTYKTIKNQDKERAEVEVWGVK